MGAFIFGHFGDRAGRKVAFVTNILVVGVTTCLTGLLPGYAKLGVAAPIFLVHAGDLIGSEHRQECLKREARKLGASHELFGSNCCYQGIIT